MIVNNVGSASHWLGLRLVGLGEAAGPVRVRVRWPDGAVGRMEVWNDVAVDRYVTLIEGQGEGE